MILLESDIPLQDLFDNLKNELIENQQANGDGCDPETGVEYDWDEAYIRIMIETPQEWENNE